MFYLIRETLEACAETDTHGAVNQYVAVLTPDEWQRRRDSFDMGIDLELDIQDIHNTKAEVNYDSLTGKFLIPDRENLGEKEAGFAFALDEKGVVFIDRDGEAARIVETIAHTRRWRMPCLERFLYDFLEFIVQGDMPMLERYETELDRMEEDILQDRAASVQVRVNEIRGNLRELAIHYDQLIDLGQELEENENGFFQESQVRYFRMFLNRMQRLHDTAASLREYTMQVRDLYHAQLEARQNRTVTLLTVVTTVFMPLTLIVGWYGMNFRYMPELESPFGYPVVIGVSVAIVVLSLLFFRHRKWL